MHTIALAAQKGGTGKTTLAVHLAATAPGRVVLVDIDPQGSATEWFDVRKAETPELVTATGDQLGNVVEAARADGVDVLLIDTPPHARSEIAQATYYADTTVIPTRPAPFDLRAAGKTVEMVTRGNGALVLNACPPRRGRSTREPSIVREAREYLDGYGLPVAPVALTERVALQHALIDGRAVTEFEPAGKAAAEIRDLWEWLSDAAA